MDELFALLENNQIEEAYQGFKKVYQETKNIVALFYIVLIEMDYHEEIDQREILQKCLILVKSSNKEIRLASYFPCLSICLDLDDYQHCYEIASLALKENVIGFLSNFAYAKGLYFYKHENNIEEIESYVNKALEDSEIAPKFREYAYIFLNTIYIEKNYAHRSQELINKVMLIFSQNDLIKYMKAQLEYHKDNPNEMIIQDAIESNYSFEILVDLSNFYLSNKKYDLALKYLYQLKEAASDKIQVRNRIIHCYFELEQYDNAIKELSEADLENDPVANYQLGECYWQKGFKHNYLQGLKYYQHSYELNDSLDTLKCICDVYKELKNTEELKKCIEILEKKAPHDSYLNMLKVNYYILIHDYDRAYKEIKRGYQFGNKKEYFMFDLYACAPNPSISYRYFRKMIKETKYIFIVLRAYYYGEYNIPINDSLVEKYFLEAEKVEEKGNCLCSLLGAIIQKKDPKKALEYFKAGMERYNNGIDSCTCAIGFYCDAKMRGIGIKKDVEGAYLLAQKTIKETLNDVSENLGNVYAQCAILLNKDLNPVFDFLVSTVERRYPISRLFMIIKVGKLIGKDVSIYEKIFKKALKYGNAKEKLYYSTNPDIFMMNNY